MFPLPSWNDCFLFSECAAVDLISQESHNIQLLNKSNNRHESNVYNSEYCGEKLRMKHKKALFEKKSNIFEDELQLGLSRNPKMLNYSDKLDERIIEMLHSSEDNSNVSRCKDEGDLIYSSGNWFSEDQEESLVKQLKPTSYKFQSSEDEVEINENPLISSVIGEICEGSPELQSSEEDLGAKISSFIPELGISRDEQSSLESDESDGPGIVPGVHAENWSRMYHQEGGSPKLLPRFKTRGSVNLPPLKIPKIG